MSAMKFGIGISKVGEVDFIARAERLGFDFCWATDSPMLRSNPWVVLALAATQTHTIELGTGVAVPGLRVAPEAANGIATINRLAPGRTFFGVGTGNTAMRTLGRHPAKVAEFADYITTVKALLAGEEAPFPGAHGTAAIRFQNPHLEYLDLDHPIPIHVWGFGARAQALAGELGDGLITGIPRGGTIGSAIANAKKGAARAQRALDDFRITALVNLLLLEDGESLTSERVLGEIGSAVMANVHYLAERHFETGAQPPNFVLPIWDDYLSFVKARDSGRRNEQLHASHYSYLDPDEARFVTPAMVRAFAIAGSPAEVAERLQALEAEGLDAINFLPPDARKIEVYEDFARRVIPIMRG